MGTQYSGSVDYILFGFNRWSCHKLYVGCRQDDCTILEYLRELMKLIIGIVGGLVLFLATMIDTSPPEEMGSCTVGDTTISPVSNLDCEGIFKEDK